MSDEEEIRSVVATWLSASKTGDVDTVLSLMSDDVVFLVAGRPAMRKSDFETAARAQIQAGQMRPIIDGVSDIQELKVVGDWAFLWSKLRVTIIPPGAPQTTRAGHTLTILQKQNGRWLLARDANLLVPVPDE